MRELVVSATVFSTILTALAFGVMLGYTVIVAILRLFGHRPRPTKTLPAPAIAVSAASSGD